VLAAALSFAGCSDGKLPGSATAEPQGPAPPSQAGPAPAGDTSPAPSQPASRPRDITFDDLKFPIERDQPFDQSMLTPPIHELVKAPIRIRGWILPQSVFTETGITSFVLVRDNMSCCFGPGAMLYDCIVVQMKPGQSTTFTNSPIAVEGTFSIEERKRPDGLHAAVFRIDADSAG
jgi:hypothetical protein